jgi:hypothetical protein
MKETDVDPIAGRRAKRLANENAGSVLMYIRPLSHH